MEFLKESMIIEVKFFTTNQLFYYEIKEKNGLKPGDKVLIANKQITELAQITKIKESAKGIILGEGRFLRKMNSEDGQKISKLKVLAREYLPLVEEKIAQHKLNSMKLFDADLSFDGKKLTIYFGAEGRIDFRDLVGDLIKSFKKAIRLQQIGARDEAKMFGGIGPCGREICCRKFLGNIESVTLDMAKEQNILTSSSKISGLCGKLMCCLSYEKDIYAELKKKMPVLGAEFKIGRKKGKVIEQNALTQTVTVKTEDGKIEKIAISAD